MTEPLLSLLRHGDAGPAIHTSEAEDDARPLTPTGIAETLRLGRTLQRLDIPFDRIVVSHRCRSIQTGEVLREILGLPLGRLAGLSDPNLSPSALLDLLLHEGAMGHPLFIGHEPHLSDLARHVGCPLNGLWPKSALVQLEGASSSWVLRLFLSPRACPPGA